MSDRQAPSAPPGSAADPPDDGRGTPAAVAARVADVDAAAARGARVTHHPERERFEISVDGELAGFAEYRLDDGVAAFMHTTTKPRLRGRGLAAQVVRAGLDEARARGWAVLPYCWYVRDFIAAHPEYRDLVPAHRRAEFGL